MPFWLEAASTFMQADAVKCLAIILFVGVCQSPSPSLCFHGKVSGRFQEERSVDTERYGKAATKSLADLLTEVIIGTFMKVQKLHSCQFADIKIPFQPSPAF